MTRAWGMPASFVHSFIFSPTPWERLGSYRFPSPSNGSLLTLPTMLFLTQVLSVEETLMYFGYTYAPNLTHQGASVITRNFIRKWLQESNIFKTLISSLMGQKCISKRSKTIQPTIKSACAKNTQGARARATVR
jgi:hypothetical protein